MSTKDLPLRRNRPSSLPSFGGKLAHKVTFSLQKKGPKLKRNRRGTRKQEKEEPFLWTVCKVGTTLMVVSGVLYIINFMIFGSSTSLLPHHRPQTRRERHRNHFVKNREEYVIPPPDLASLRKKKQQQQQESFSKDNDHNNHKSPHRIPVFSLDAQKSEFDVYGIALKYLSTDTIPSTTHKKQKTQDFTNFLQSAKTLREMFAKRFGGENAARAVLEKGLTTLEKQKNHNNDDHANNNNNNNNKVESTTTDPRSLPPRLALLAHRIRDALNRQNNNEPLFQIAFVGSSATAGYGNDFSQSYPLVLQDIMREPFRHLGLFFKVTNAAMNGLSPFPFGWCLENFVGTQVDVLSWDFGAVLDSTLEAFIRQVATAFPKQQQQRPMMMFRDSPDAYQRRDIIQKYVDSYVLTDSLLVHTDTPINAFTDVKEKHLPLGFQGWKDFGAPHGAPGKDDGQNLSVKQHELTAWLIAMDLLSAMELLVADMMDESLNLIEKEETAYEHHLFPDLPSPFSEEAQKEDKNDWNTLLFRFPSQSSIQCRTSFEPRMGDGGDLTDIIVSGTIGDEVDLLLPKGPMYYKSGWIMDLDKDEKQQRKRLQQWDFLGFRDVKKALYGVPSSGPLQLFLPAPLKTASEEKDNQVGSVEDRSAKLYFRSVIVCESNVPRLPESCKIQSDATFTIGGVKVLKAQTIDSDIVSSFGKQLCTLLEIPDDARLTTPGERILPKKEIETGRSLKQSTVELSPQLGLSVEIEVTNRSIHWAKGPCSVAHVLWESIA